MGSTPIWDTEVRRAIADHHFVAFTYGSARRIAEPHVYGLKSGKRQLLVYQVAGESRSGGLPNWRRVDLAKVRDLRVIDERFKSRRRVPIGGREGFDLVLAGVEPAGFAFVGEPAPVEEDEPSPAAPEAREEIVEEAHDNAVSPGEHAGGGSLHAVPIDGVPPPPPPHAGGDSFHPGARASL
jgi:hypothetical protein